MSPSRLRVVLLLAFVVLSGLNYWWFEYRTQTIENRARSAVYTNNVDYAIGQTQAAGPEAQREFDYVIIHEVVLVVLVGVGVVLLARRK
jgi:hypothetical protein